MVSTAELLQRIGLHKLVLIRKRPLPLQADYYQHMTPWVGRGGTVTRRNCDHLRGQTVNLKDQKMPYGSYY